MRRSYQYRRFDSRKNSQARQDFWKVAESGKNRLRLPPGRLPPGGIASAWGAAPPLCPAAVLIAGASVSGGWNHHRLTLLLSYPSQRASGAAGFKLHAPAPSPIPSTASCGGIALHASPLIPLPGEACRRGGGVPPRRSSRAGRSAGLPKPSVRPPDRSDRWRCRSNAFALPPQPRRRVR